MNAELFRWIGGAVAVLGVISVVAWHRPGVAALRPLRKILERLPMR